MTATVLAPDWRRTSRTTVGTPFNRAVERCSLVPSSVRPMSRMRTDAPPIVATTRSSKARGSARRPIVRSVASRAPRVTLPPAASAFCRTIASRTSVMGIPKAASRSASTHTLTARSNPPTICTSPTPADRSRRIFTTLSASSVSSRRGRSPARATVRTGCWSLSNFETRGGVASFGRSLRMVATRSRTSWAAVSMSRLRLKVTITTEVPGPEIDRSSSIPSTVLTASSMRLEIPVSTSSAEAPGSWVRIETVGRSTEGNRSTPRRR